MTSPTTIADRTDSDAAGRRAQVPLAVLTLVAGGLLLAGSYLGTVGMIVAVAVVQAALVVSWVLGSGLPGRIGGIVLGVMAAAATDVAVTRYHESGYQPVLAVLGVAIPLMFVHQLTRGVVRSRVVESLADITLLVLAVTAIGGLILLRYQGNGDRTVLAVVGAMTAGLVVGHLADMVIPAPRFDESIDRGLPGVVLGIVAGGAVGTITLREIIDFTGGRGLFVGAAVAAVACLLSIGATFAWTHSTLTAATPTATIPTAAIPTATIPIATAGPAPDPAVPAPLEPTEGPGDTALMRDLAEDAAADTVSYARVWTGIPALRPLAAVLITVSLSAPAGYVLVNALGG